MKYVCVWMSAFALVGCTDSIEDQLSVARTELESAQLDLQKAENVCGFGPERSNDEIREEAFAEWDAAAGENLDDISPEQEWEIRKSLGDEMGLAPSEVNGWKEIYRGRAKQAKIVLASHDETKKMREEMRATQQKDACESVAGFKQVVRDHQSEVDRLGQGAEDGHQ